MPRGLGHWYPEHQGNAKTPADRGRFPPKCRLRNDSLVLRFSYCPGDWPDDRSPRRRKHEGEPSYNGLEVQGRVKGGRQVEGSEDRQASRRASPRTTST